MRDFHEAVADVPPRHPARRDAWWAWATWRSSTGTPPRRAPGCGTSRTRVFVDAYGLSEQERHDLVALLEPRARAMHDFLAAQTVESWTTLCGARATAPCGARTPT